MAGLGDNLVPKFGRSASELPTVGTANRRASWLAQVNDHNANSGGKRIRSSVIDSRGRQGDEMPDVDIAALKAGALHTSMAKMATHSDVRRASVVVGKMHRMATAGMDALAPTAEHHLDKHDEEGDGLQTNGEAIFNLLNNCLGSGMVGMAFAFKQTGIIPAFCTMLGAALLNKYTLLLNYESCMISDCDPAATTVGKKAYGVFGQVLMVVMFTGLAFFCMVSYVDATTDAVMGLSELFIAEGTFSHTQFLLGCWVILLVPPTLIRSMKGVAVMSTVAFSGAVVILTSMFIVSGKTIYQQGGVQWDKINIFPESIDHFFAGFPIMVLMFSIQAGGGVVLATMKDRSDANIRNVCNKAYILVGSIDTLVGLSAYLAFNEATQGDVLKALPPGFLSTICQAAVLDLVVLSYMVMCIPCKISIIDLIFGQNEALQEPKWITFFSVTMVVNVCALVFAYFVSDLSLVLGIDGAVITNFVAFIMPATYHMSIRSKSEEPDQRRAYCSMKNVGLYLIVMFGIGSLVLGTKQVIVRMTQGDAPVPTTTPASALMMW